MIQSLWKTFTGSIDLNLFQHLQFISFYALSGKMKTNVVILRSPTGFLKIVEIVSSKSRIPHIFWYSRANTEKYDLANCTAFSSRCFYVHSISYNSSMDRSPVIELPNSLSLDGQTNLKTCQTIDYRIKVQSYLTFGHQANAVALKVLSHQIRLAWKWNCWINLHEYKNRRW